MFKKANKPSQSKQTKQNKTKPKSLTPCALPATVLFPCFTVLTKVLEFIVYPLSPVSHFISLLNAFQLELYSQ